jgi:DNA-directed RNA polymerase subunit beta'
MVDTTIGRMIVGELLPEGSVFSLVNKELSKKKLAFLIDYTYRHAGTKETVILADRLKDLGYEYATRAGISICINDMKIPVEKEEFVEMRKKRPWRSISSIPTV